MAKGQGMPINDGERHPDTALIPFLVLLERDLSGRPTTAARPVSDTLMRRMDALAAEIGQTDPDAPIMGEVNL